MTQPPIVPGPAEQPLALANVAGKPTKNPRTLLIVMAAAIGVLAVALAGAVIARPSDPTSPVADDASTTTRQAAKAPTPEPEYGPLTASTITLAVVITSQQCFGSAGCNVEFEIEPAFGINASLIEPGSVWAVTYELTGAEDPYVNTLEVTVRETEVVAGGYVPHGVYTTSGLADRVSTASASSELAAKVTNIRER